ncbi:MAG: hypothetical protein L0Y75_01225 [Acidobacteria bacterium]|nr:hypothetical protein [Acidobacteriota bacterium]
MFNGRKTSSILLSAICALLAVSTLAQQPPPGAKWKLDKVEIAGLKIQKQEDVLPAAELQVGQIVDLDGIKAASQRLANTGLFKRVAYRYRYGDDRIEVTFEVEEAKAEKLNCVFDNFVWFNDQEIRETVVKDVPDFDGSAAQSDFVIGRIKQSLTRLLREKSVTGEVVHDINQDISSGRTDHVFKVKDADLKICSIQFTGASARLAPVFIKEMQPLVKADYSRMEVRLFANAALIPIYRQRGYLKARFQPVQAQPGSDGDCKKGIAVTLPVEEGPLFYWDKAVWSGNQVLPAEDLDAAMEMKSGAVADETRIIRGFREISVAYGKKGYVAAKLKPSPVFEDEKQRVSYQIAIEEGAQYRMGQMTIAGLSEGEIKKLNEKWKLKSGDIFDSSYPNEFLNKAMREGALSQSSMTKDFGAQFKPDHQKLTVDVVIQFK